MFNHLVFMVYSNGSCNLYSFKKNFIWCCFYESDCLKENFFVKKFSRKIYLHKTLKFFQKKNGF
jgi:hypothetical protein